MTRQEAVEIPGVQEPGPHLACVRPLDDTGPLPKRSPCHIEGPFGFMAVCTLGLWDLEIKGADWLGRVGQAALRTTQRRIETMRQT